MIRTYLVTGTVIALSVVASPARADHDHELGYILGGALIGAAIGGIVHHSHRHAGHSHRYVGAHHVHYAPVGYYAPAYRFRHVHGYGRHYRARHHGHRHIGRRYAYHRHH